MDIFGAIDTVLCARQYQLPGAMCIHIVAELKIPIRSCGACFEYWSDGRGGGVFWPHFPCVTLMFVCGSVEWVGGSG